MEFTETEINDIICCTIIRTLKILQETKDEGENLNTVDFEYIIDCRFRDLHNPEILDAMSNQINLGEFV